MILKDVKCKKCGVEIFIINLETGDYCPNCKDSPFSYTELNIDEGIDLLESFINQPNDGKEVE